MDFSEAYDPFRALSKAWEVLKRAPATMLVGGFLLMITESGGGSGNIGSAFEDPSEDEMALLLLIAGGVCLFAIGLWLFNCLLRVGFATAVERVLSSGEEEMGDLFRGKGRWLSMVGSTFISGLLIVASFLPTVLLAVAVGFAAGNAGGAEAAVPFVILVVVATAPIWIYVALGLSLAPEAVAFEGHGAIESIQRSWAVVRGNRLRLLLYYIVIGIVSFLGIFACCIGVIFTSSLGAIASYESYLRLVRPHEEQGGWTLS